MNRTVPGILFFVTVLLPAMPVSCGEQKPVNPFIPGKNCLNPESAPGKLVLSDGSGKKRQEGRAAE